MIDARRAFALIVAVIIASLGAPVGAAAARTLTSPLTMAAAGNNDWWVSGTYPCGPDHDCAATLHTTDGGRHFRQIPVPTELSASMMGLAFANPQDGVAYDTETGLWTTHDGGTHWHHFARQGVDEVAAADGEMYAVRQPADSSISEVWRSPAGRDHWRRLSVGAVWADLVIRGRDVLVEPDDRGAQGTAAVLISHDRGAHFVRHPLAMFGPGAVPYCGFSQPSVQTIWALCSDALTTELLRSTDSGRRFVSLPPPPGPASQSRLFAGLSARTAIFTPTVPFVARRLLRTTDAALHYTSVGPSSAEWRALTFTDARHGTAIVGGRETPWSLYRTSDEGEIWHHVTLRFR